MKPPKESPEEEIKYWCTNATSEFMSLYRWIHSLERWEDRKYHLKGVDQCIKTIDKYMKYIKKHRKELQ